jgi:peptide deformylase
MAILEIKKYPDPVLSQAAATVTTISTEIQQLIEDMLDTMYAAPGIGLAAPQVGVSQRVVVLDIDHENPGKQVHILINPAVIETDGEVVWEEGCLSVVDFTAEVRRAARVVVQAYDPEEREIRLEADGLLSVALQHEIDHLDGKLFIDRISRLKRDLYSRKRKKMLRTGIDPVTETSHTMI